MPPACRKHLKRCWGIPLGLKILSEEDSAPSRRFLLCGYPGSPSGTGPRLTFSDKKAPTTEYSFENFIVGSSNKFAHAAHRAVASKPAGYYNPCLSTVASGLGKTHLLYAICNEVKRHTPAVKIIYTKGEYIANELIEAIGSGTTPEFRAKYRQVDVLLVDDIQFIAGKVSTQEEFFHTFDALHQANKQIVLTSDRPPREISALEDRQAPGFEMGLLADIQPRIWRPESPLSSARPSCWSWPSPMTLRNTSPLSSKQRPSAGGCGQMYAELKPLLEGEQPTLIPRRTPSGTSATTASRFRDPWSASSMKKWPVP